MNKQGKKTINKKKSSNEQQQVKIGLADELESLKHIQVNDSKIIKSSNKRNRDDNDEHDEEFIDNKLSNKILNEARKQQMESDSEEDARDGEARKSEITNATRNRGVKFNHVLSNSFLKKKQKTSDDDDDDSNEEDERELNDQNEMNYYKTQNENLQINEQDEKTFDLFMSKESTKRKTIADIIMEKLTEKKTELQSKLSDLDDGGSQVDMNNNLDLDERVIEMYKQIKEILSKYRSGKLPKAFKIIPSLNQWEHVLYLTEPDTWSAAAMYQATRIFASNLNAKMAQRFFNLILLPRIRDDIQEFKRLNFHLYMAIRKALFKPSAFFKGVLIPLCESKTCTLKEAIIIGSILGKQTIPMLHSAACLLKLSEMEYTGANSIFIRILLDKKYALPYRVIDALVNHFYKFKTDPRQLPVLWHQALATFVQRYKQDIAQEQKELLLEVIKVHTHRDITKEIRYELINSKSREDENDDDRAMEI